MEILISMFSQIKPAAELPAPVTALIFLYWLLVACLVGGALDAYKFKVLKTLEAYCGVISRVNGGGEEQFGDCTDRATSG